MKKLLIILIMFPILGFSQQVVTALDIVLKDRIINYDGDTLISSFGGTGNYYMNVRTGVNALDAVNVQQLSDSLSAGSGNYWTYLGNYLYPDNTTDSVGIGTATPKAILEVAGRIEISGTGNSVFIGEDAGLVDDLTDNDNVFIGYEAGKTNTSGSANIGLGYSAMKDNTTGNKNTAIGIQALENNTTSEANVGIGYWALKYNTTGEYNIGLGNMAGRFTKTDAALTNSDSSIFIGYETKANANYEVNQIVIGNKAIGNGDNTATIGDDNVTAVYLNENGTAKLWASTLGSSGLILSGSDSLIDAGAVFAYLDTTNVLYWSDTLSFLATDYDVDTLTTSIYDSLEVHLDTLQSHNDRINAITSSTPDSIRFKVDATNNSQVMFIVGKDTTWESFGHGHNQYFLKTGGNISGFATISEPGLILDNSDTAINANAVFKYLDTTNVLYWPDTLSFLATDYDVDTLTASIYDSLEVHLDTLQSHNTRILANVYDINYIYDSLAVHLDTLQSHNTRISANVADINILYDTLNNYWSITQITEADTTYWGNGGSFTETDPIYATDSASLKTHVRNDLDLSITNEIQTLSIDSTNRVFEILLTDGSSVKFEDTVIDTTGMYQDLSGIRDTVGILNDSIRYLYDSIAVHRDSLESYYDTLQSHNTRILANVDSLAVHLDTSQSHNVRINALANATPDSVYFKVDATNNSQVMFIVGKDTVKESFAVDYTQYALKSVVEQYQDSLFWSQSGDTLRPATAADNIQLESTTTASNGVIFKGSAAFIHDYHNLTGGGAVPIGDNIFIGKSGNFTMGSTATNTGQSSNNVGIGYNCLRLLTTGAQNVAIGTEVLQNVTTGVSNTAIGSAALNDCNTGNSNTAIGTQSLIDLTSGSLNIGIGANSLGYITTSSFNVGIGYFAGGETDVGNNTTGADGVFIGMSTKSSADGQTNEIVIGANAIGNGSNTATIGDDNVTAVYLNENGTAQLNASTLGTSGLILNGSDSLIDANAVYDYVSSFTGTVESVGFNNGTGFTINGSPITTSGSFTFALDFSEFTDITESTGIKFVVTDPVEKEIAIGDVDLSDFNDDITSAYATKELDNLASVAINTSLISDTDNIDALGSAAKSWSDIFIGDGGVVNFNNGDVILAHKANVLELTGGNFNVNSNSIISSGYIGRDASNFISWSIDNSLGININSVRTDIVSISTGDADNDKLVTRGYVDDALRKITVNLSSAQVSALGTYKELIAAPGAGKYIRVSNWDVKITVTTQLDVGGQALNMLYSGGGDDYMGIIPNTAIETASTKRFIQGDLKGGGEILDNTSVGVILSSTTNPASGDATMSFNITYEILNY